MAVRRARRSRPGGGQGLQVTVDHGRELYELGRRLRDAPADLAKEMRRGVLKAVAPIGRDVRRHLSLYMPDRGGFTAELSRSLRIRTQIQTRYFAAVRVTLHAVGAKSRRDVGALDKGVLRHPVFGRYRVAHRQRRFILNPWVAQRITAGFWTNPVQFNKPAARNEIRQVLHRVGLKITKG